MNKLLQNKKTIIICSVAAILIIVAVILGFTASEAAKEIVIATRQYNIAVREYNALSHEYDTFTANCCVDNISGMPSSFGILKEESESFFSCLLLIFRNNPSKIASDTQAVRSISQAIPACTEIAKQITAPSDEWVKERLLLIPEINKIGSVTEENNPDGLLNKEGGYTGCVYFSHADIHPDGVQDVIREGTDAGGAIEIYPTLSDALERCEYLSQFDGTILYSGSYAIIGTMVVRTSYAFSDEQQLALTSAITKALTTTAK